MTAHRPASPTGWLTPPFMLSLMLLLLGLAMAAEVAWSGAPPPPGPLLGAPGVVRTLDPQLRELEERIANRRAGAVAIRLTQADIDAELAWQLERLAGRIPVQDAWVRPGAGVLEAGGVLALGPAQLPATIELAVGAQGCRPVVDIRSISLAGAAPDWLRARADALVRRTLDDALERGLGFCLTEVTFLPGEVRLDGRVEGD